MKNLSEIFENFFCKAHRHVDINKKAFGTSRPYVPHCYAKGGNVSPLLRYTQRHEEVLWIGGKTPFIYNPCNGYS